jgi:excinuclease ABC subunit A
VGQLRGEPERGACRAVEGAGHVTDVVLIDSSSLTRSPRSNPGTVSRAFDQIRQRFAETREARALGLRPGWFSFNGAGGRCEACEGSGQVVVDMQFLEEVRVPCEACGGSRYRPEARSLHLRGRSIVDVLELGLDELCEVFADDERLCERLEPLRRAGLGYLTLGQPLSTLSGGEMQRLRLARALGDPRPGALYVLDEPTTGLHPHDVEGLLAGLDALLEAGGSVLVVEHNLDVIRAADHVVDLGPEGGPEGGCLVACGTPAEVARVAESRTGAALRGELSPGARHAPRLG